MRHHLVLGTAGHIDHGKSSLVRALTGSDPDRLPEEKARGVTIELGFAHLSLEGSNTQYEIGIVDVPGHADFVNNMVAGVGALDLAIFIVAADDGWMPQSEEHLHILSYLGISNIIIALTKADMCEDVDFTIEVLRDELKDTSIADAPIIHVSSITGDGITELKNTITETLSTHPLSEKNGSPRLAIDRIFSPKGTGTVVTGTLCGGPINIGDTLTLQPPGLTAKVRYIQNHNQSLDTALPGMRTALNLPDLPINAPGKVGAERGHALASPDIGIPTETIDVVLNRMARTVPGTKPKTLRHMETVMLHHGSSRCHARVILQDRNHLNPGESCLAQLRLEHPMFFLLGDRMVLRDGGQQNTLAGATVLDTRSKRMGFRNAERADFLSRLVGDPLNLAEHITARLVRDYTLDREQPLYDHPFSDSEVTETVKTLTENKTILSIESSLMHADWWQEQIDQAEQNILSWHKRHPDLPGIPVDRLAETVPDCSERLFTLLLNTLESTSYHRQGNTIASVNHTLTLPDDIKSQAEYILHTLDQAGLQPPHPNDLCPSSQHTQALKFLIRSGQVVELEPKAIISASSRDEAMKLVSDYISEHGPSTASELRQHLDTNRKVIMPLLEYMDELKITVRNDNHRSLASMH